MGKRDYRQRESKKPKKDSKRSAASVVLTTPIAQPEVVEKKRPPREES